jgi:hypothetical protein
MSRTAALEDQGDRASSPDTIVTRVPPSVSSLRRRPPWGPPRSEGPDTVRESAPPKPPDDVIFVAVAQAVLADLERWSTGPVQVAMLILNVRREEKTFTIQVVGCDRAGALISVRPSRELRVAASRMITRDARDGNDSWRRLVATITPEARGKWVTFQVW